MTWTIQPRSRLGALAAIEAGAGPKVVLLHGVGLRAEAWGGQIAALAQSGHVTAIDLPGHGESPRLDAPAGLTAFTDAIAAELTKPAVVIGHSFGAMIALDLAARHPHLVQAVAALNSIFERDPAAKEAVAARAASLDGQTVADPAAPLARWFGPAPSAACTACESWLRTVDPQGYRAAYRVFAQADGPSASALKSMRCPALFLTGAEEPNSTPQMSERMAALAPLGRAIILEGAAHMLPMTHAAEVAALLKQFIHEAHP